MPKISRRQALTAIAAMLSIAMTTQTEWTAAIIRGLGPDWIDNPVALLDPETFDYEEKQALKKATERAREGMQAARAAFVVYRVGYRQIVVDATAPGRRPIHPAAWLQSTGGTGLMARSAQAHVNGQCFTGTEADATEADIALSFEATGARFIYSCPGPGGTFYLAVSYDSDPPISSTEIEILLRQNIRRIYSLYRTAENN